MKFSVLTPVYNGEATLRSAYDTLLRQTCDDWEWIIVDDGSTDGTPALADKLAAEDARHRIRVVHQANSGVSVARNRALSEAKGEWLVWLDADDAYVPDAFAKISELVEYNPDAAVFHFPYLVAGSEKEGAKGAVGPTAAMSGEDAYNLLYVKENTRGQHWQPWRFVHRHGFVPHFRPGIIHEDVDVLPQFLRTLPIAVVTSVPLYIYTPAREGAATQFFTPRRVRDILDVTANNWHRVDFRPMLTWNLWGYYRSLGSFSKQDRCELYALFAAHPEYLGLSASEFHRNVGIEFARIVAIYLVVLQHIVFLGGLANANAGILHRLQARLLEAASQTSVNIFALISGFVFFQRIITDSEYRYHGCGRRFIWDWKHFLKLWLQVFVTGLGMLGFVAMFSLGLTHSKTFATLPFKPVSITVSDCLTAFFPLFRDEYWYFTGYFWVFLLSPFLATVASRRGAGWLALALLGIVGAVTAWPGGVELLPLNKGYSAAWLVLLAFVGMCIAKYNAVSRYSRPLICFSVAALAVALTAGQRFLMSAVPALKTFFGDEWTLHHYTSLTVIIGAVAFVLGASVINFGRSARKLICLFSSCVFGVYLLHVQPVFFNNFFKGHFQFLDTLPDWLFGIGAAGTAALVFLICIVIEKLRRRIMR